MCFIDCERLREKLRTFEPVHHIRTWIALGAGVLFLTIVFVPPRHSLYTISVTADLATLTVGDRRLHFIAACDAETNCTAPPVSSPSPHRVIILPNSQIDIQQIGAGVIRLTVTRIYASLDARPNAAERCTIDSKALVGSIDGTAPLCSGQDLFLSLTEFSPPIAFSASGLTVGQPSRELMEGSIRTGTVSLTQSSTSIPDMRIVRFLAEQVDLVPGDVVTISNPKSKPVPAPGSGREVAKSEAARDASHDGEKLPASSSGSRPVLEPQRETGFVERERGDEVNGLIYFPKIGSGTEEPGFQIVAHTTASNGVKIKRVDSEYTIAPTLFSRFRGSPLLSILLAVVALAGQLISLVPPRRIDFKQEDRKDWLRPRRP